MYLLVFTLETIKSERWALAHATMGKTDWKEDEEEEKNYNAHVERSYTYINTQQTQIPYTNANTFEMLQANNSNSSGNNGRIKTDLKPCLVNVKRCIESNAHIMKHQVQAILVCVWLGFENTYIEVEYPFCP